MSRILETIVELQRSLRELREAERRLEALPEWMQALHAEHAARSAEIASGEAAQLKAALDRRAAESATAAAQEKLKHYQQQISMVRTQREYGALLHEIDGARNEIRGLEDQALEAIERGEEAGRETAAQRAAFAELDGRYQQELEKWNAEKPSLRAAAEATRARVDDLRGGVPGPYLSRFERLLDRYRGEALALVRPLERAGRGPQLWACGGCNYRVRPQVVVEIRNQGTIIECDSCKRILYLDSAE
jgi:predicted  nucleic acid-binding Zn-ribbon protein